MISDPTPQEPGKEVGISIDVVSTGGITLDYTWNADGGEIVRGQGSPAITYRVPEEPGTYNIRVRVAWDGQSVEKVTTIQVEESILETPTPASTSIPVTDTPIPVTSTPEETTVPEENGGEEKSVIIFGTFVDEDARRFETSMEPFETRTGIDIQYEGSGDFATLISARAEHNNAPDIAVFQQPGLLADLVRKGQNIDLNDWFEEGYLEQQYAEHWLDMATIDNMMSGVWYRANVKSLVWYPVPEFEQAGYEIPKTWDEMLALSDQIVADGKTPWCIGIESGGATGWVATDWMEDIMLRTQPVEKYDAWVNGELSFDSPEVKNAAEIMGEIWFNEDYALGGPSSITTTPFGDAPIPMFNNPPDCYLHRQASFIPAFFPGDVQVGEDVDFFYLPPIKSDEFPKPVLTAGDIFAAFNDRAEVREVMEYLTTGESTKAWLQSGGFVSPHEDTPLDWYPTETDRKYAEILSEASVVRFDGSDLMPGAVGAGSFWTGMVDYVEARGNNLDVVMGNIDNSWPK
jgi:alpha-glucoside transport system substrate-binding protein